MSKWQKTIKKFPKEGDIVFVALKPAGSRDDQPVSFGVIMFKNGKFGNGSWTHWMHPPRVPVPRAEKQEGIHVPWPSK
jgi:hypothetical protein